MDLFSINYLHSGAPKIWYTISYNDGQKLETLCKKYSQVECPAYFRHKNILVNPLFLEKNKIDYDIVSQFSGT